jgi:type IV secretion system protein VirB5
MHSLRLAFGAAMLALAGLPAARAQFAVIDTASLAQLVQQIQLLGQQLAETRAQLLQSQALYQSMTGARGMQTLLPGSQPNYLPVDWNSLLLAAQGQGPYTSLATQVSGGITQNAVLSAAQLSLLSPDQQSLIAASRQDAALSQALTQLSLANASGRFNDLQRMSNAIGGTADQKGVLELQATLSAEQGLLLAEQTKLQVLDRAVQAQEMSTREREREAVIAGQGNFASRFRPVLP